MILLGVNIDHCATVRQARYRGYASSVGGPVEPDPITLATLAMALVEQAVAARPRLDDTDVQAVLADLLESRTR